MSQRDRGKGNRANQFDTSWQPLISRLDKGRLRRAKASVKQGDVLNLQVKGNRIMARVQQGGYAHGICEVSLPLFQDWRPYQGYVAQWLAERPQMLATCLAGGWSDEFLGLTQQAGLRLFPNEEVVRQIERESHCTCQEADPLCRHITIVLCKMMESVESDFLQALTFVGLNINDLLDEAHRRGHELYVSQFAERQLLYGITEEMQVNTAVDISSQLEASMQHAAKKAVVDLMRGRLYPILDATKLAQLWMNHMASVCEDGDGSASTPVD